MKKLLLSLITMIVFNSVNAQETKIQKESKAYLGVSIGVAFPGGYGSENLNGSGINLGLINFGYRFSKNWGTTLNLTSSGFKYKNVDGAAFGVGIFSVGPMYTASLGKKMSLDIKPQYAFSVAGKTKGLDALDSATIKGTGIVLGSSINFGITKGFKFSINLDYNSGKWKEIEAGGETLDLNEKFNALALGAGLRYNF